MDSDQVKIMMNYPSLEELDRAAALAHEYLQPTPLLRWPLLEQRTGCETWVKHENHNPTGAFKVRGGLVFFDRLKQRDPHCPGMVTATRGNHGQSVAFAARHFGIPAVVVVPQGNSADKNRAMQALGAELIEHGQDFDEAVEYASELSRQRGLLRMPSFHGDLVNGVASYSLEMFRAQPELQRVYVPIGLGSGVCGMISARNALGLKTEIVGVVSAAAPCYQLSLAAGHCVNTDTADTLADGMAVRVPSAEALAMMQGNLADVVSVSDEEVLEAMAWYFSDTHNVAEGAGAAPLAALLQQREASAGMRVGLVLTGGNVDSSLYCHALSQAG